MADRHDRLNVMSLMGVVMLAGITMSNSILIVEFAQHLVEEGHDGAEAIITSCHVRLRPILMTTLATIIGLLPMALKMGTAANRMRRWRWRWWVGWIIGSGHRVCGARGILSGVSEQGNGLKWDRAQWNPRLRVLPPSPEVRALQEQDRL